MDESLGRIPDKVGDGLLRVDSEKVLEDAEERDLLRTVRDLAEDRVENLERT